MTHILDGISCRHCQQLKSSTGGAHNSQSGWDFIQVLSAIEIEHRRHTQLTDWMDFMQALSAIEIKHRRRTRLTSWMGFHPGIVSNQDRAQKAHTTHRLDGISCRHCQQLKSSTGDTHDSHSGWDFMQALSAIKIEHRRRTQLTPWMGFHPGIVSD